MSIEAKLTEAQFEEIVGPDSDDYYVGGMVDRTDAETAVEAQLSQALWWMVAWLKQQWADDTDRSLLLIEVLEKEGIKPRPEEE